MKQRKTCLNRFLCIDDFGNEVVLGRYSEQPILACESLRYPPMLPTVKGFYAEKAGFENHHAENVRLYNESEANCNTCAKLNRIPHEKNKHGFLHGTCAPLGHHTFHPEDPMHMPCWEARA